MADLVVRDVINPDHPLPGDVNGDGTVDEKDLLRLMINLGEAE